MSEADPFDHWGGESSERKRSRLDGYESVKEVAPPKFKKSRENHREVEKRRRDKMKLNFTDLENVLASFNALSTRPNKLNLLRSARTCIMSLGGPGYRNPDESYDNPHFLTGVEFKNLISEGARGFLFILTCDTGHVVYVTDTVSRVLNRSEQEWLGTTIYDQVHVNDMEKVREQLSTHGVPDRTLDLKSGTLKKGCQASTRYRECRRNFVCRMKVGGNSDCMVSRPLKLANRLGSENYAVVHCSGYVRNGLGNEIGAIKNYYLIAMGRVEIIPSSPSCKCKETPMHPTDISDPFKDAEFVLKLLPDERVAFADERITDVLGFAPHELLNKSCFDFFHIDDYLSIKDGFHQAIKLNGQEVKFVCRFKSKNLGWIWSKIVAVSFTNPFSNEMEFLICTCSNAILEEIPSRISTNEMLQNFNSSENLLNTLGTSNFLNEMQNHDFSSDQLSVESAADFPTSLVENNESILDVFNAISNFK